MTKRDSSEKPLYRAAVDTLHRRMENGIYPVGGRLPGVRRLARELGVSVSTMVRAMELLEAMGRLEARPRSGFYVRAPRQRSRHRPASQAPSEPRDVSGQERVLALLRGDDPPGALSLASATPDPDRMPAARLNAALAACARRRTAADARYDFPPGHAPLREAIARRMFSFGCPVEPADVVVTSGCQNALGLALRTVCEAGDLVAVESPAYYGLLQIIEATGLRVLEIPSDPDTGLSLEALRLALDNWPVRACVLVPSFSNPTGSCMPDARRRALAALGRERELTIIEDDIYGDLAHNGVRPLPVKAFDTADRVIYCNSFSKTLAPDLRIGWVCGRRHTERLCYLQFAGQLAASGLAQRALTDLLAQGQPDRHLRRVRPEYAANIARTVALVDASFPAGTEITQPAGGYVLWLRIPGSERSGFHQRAMAAGIRLAPGTLFSTGERYADCYRINCSRRWGGEMEAGLRRLGELAHRSLDAGPAT